MYFVFQENTEITCLGKSGKRSEKWLIELPTSAHTFLENAG